MGQSKYLFAILVTLMIFNASYASTSDKDLADVCLKIFEKDTEEIQDDKDGADKNQNAIGILKESMKKHAQCFTKKA